MKKIFFLCFFVISIFLSSLNASWYEEVEVRVLDKEYNPVPNATVYIVWEVSKTKGNATTKPALTNERGRAYFKLTNVEFKESDANKDYIVYVQYQNSNFSKKFTAGVGTMPRTVVIDAYPVIIRAVDNSNKPLKIKILLDNKIELNTDQNGYVEYVLTAGEHILKPIFYDLEQVKRIKIENKTTIDLKLELYNFNLKVVDDNGEPIEKATVSIGPFSYKTDQNGSVQFYNLTKKNVWAQVSYQKYKVHASFDLETSEQGTIVIDRTPPLIRDIHTSREGDKLQIRAVIEDPGKYASGLVGKARLNLIYKINEEREGMVPMYLVAYNTYEALLKIEPDTKMVKYTIEASDANSNTAISSDVYVLERKEAFVEEQAEQYQQNLSEILGTQNIFVFIMLVVIIIGSYYFYKTKIKPQKQPPEQEQKTPPKNIFKAVPKKNE